MPLGEVFGGVIEALLELLGTGLALPLLLLASVAAGAWFAVETWPLPYGYWPAFAGCCAVQLAGLGAMVLLVRGLRHLRGGRRPSTIRSADGALLLLLFGHAGALAATAGGTWARAEPAATPWWALTAGGAAAVVGVLGVCVHHVARR